MRSFLILTIILAVHVNDAIGQRSFDFVLMPSLASTSYTSLSAKANTRYKQRPAFGFGLNYNFNKEFVGIRIGVDFLDSGDRREIEDLRHNDFINSETQIQYEDGVFADLTLDSQHKYVSLKIMLNIEQSISERLEWTVSVGPSIEIHRKSLLHSKYSLDQVRYEYKWTDDLYATESHTIGARIETDLRYSVSDVSQVVIGGFYRTTLRALESDISDLKLTNIGLSVAYSISF